MTKRLFLLLPTLLITSLLLAACGGGQALSYREEHGVKVFELTTRLVKWRILPDVPVTAMTYNGTVPGPEIRVTQGDRVRVLLKNDFLIRQRFTGTASWCRTTWMACLI